MSEKYLLGVDLGTTAIKVGLFDDQGQKIATDTQEHQLMTPGGGVIEQTPEAYWEAFKKGLKTVVEESGVDKEKILALSFSSQGETMVFLDKEHRPLHPFFVWMDTRAQEEAEIINSWFSADEILQKTGQGPIISLYPACKVLWMKRHHPEIFKQIDKMLLLDDYFLFRMGGYFCAEGSNWCTSYMWDIGTRLWWPEMLEKLELRPEQLPEMKESATLLGKIYPEIADELGLSHDLQLVVGGLDQSCGTIGVGNVEPGIFSENTGAVLAVCTKVDHTVLDPGGELPCFYDTVPGMYMLHTGAKGGIMLRWLRDNLCLEEMEEEKRTGKDAYAIMDEMAEKIPAGSDGLVLLPNFAGAGAPDTDQYARGLLYGLNLEHTKAHIIRAFMEAIAMNMCRMVDYSEKVTGQQVKEVRTMGGAAKSPLWCQIKADILGRDVITMKNTQDAGALGAALLAGTGIGLWPSLAEMAKKVAQTDRIYKPNPANREAYDQALKRYDMLTNAIKGLTKELC